MRGLAFPLIIVRYVQSGPFAWSGYEPAIDLTGYLASEGVVCDEHERATKKLGTQPDELNSKYYEDK